MQGSYDNIASKEFDNKNINDGKISKNGRKVILDISNYNIAHENFWGNNKGQIRVKEMRQTIDEIKEQYDQRIFLHEKFKRLINYKERVGSVEPRCQITNGLDSPKNYSIIEPGLNTNNIQIGNNDNFKLHQQYYDQNYLHKRSEKLRRLADKNCQYKHELVNSSLESIIESLDIILNGIKNYQTDNIDIQRYLNAHQNSLLQLMGNLQSRNFFEFAIQIQSYSRQPFLTDQLTPIELESDLQIIGLVNQLLLHKQDESYQNVLAQKVQIIYNKYQKFIKNYQDIQLELKIPDIEILNAANRPTNFMRRKKKSMNRIDLTQVLPSVHLEKKSKREQQQRSVSVGVNRRNIKKLLNASNIMVQLNDRQASQDDIPMLENKNSIDENGANFESQFQYYDTNPRENTSIIDMAQTTKHQDLRKGLRTSINKRKLHNRSEISPRLNDSVKNASHNITHLYPNHYQTTKSSLVQMHQPKKNKIRQWNSLFRQNPHVVSILLKQIDKYIKGNVTSNISHQSSILQRNLQVNKNKDSKIPKLQVQNYDYQ
ncbi:UNKNOWN [Stylonychia lemnae]|uniref:Uncharacterized protein n=1 Tax=Stylonychia lemnae TaxID=5949 RepID=A0A078B2T1_STYLE|nr:UNKNOWN [Stylonychia lemnae]|eukprot:CDW88779.1 UNKNOWN [Stylonychia lemnae]